MVYVAQEAEGFGRQVRVARGPCMKTTTMLATVILLATTMPAQAAVIFSDNFDRPDSSVVGNGWVELDEVFSPSDARIEGDKLFLSVPSEAAHELNIGQPLYGVRFTVTDIIGALNLLTSTDGGITYDNSTPLTGPGDHIVDLDLGGVSSAWVKLAGAASRSVNAFSAETVPEPSTLGLIGLGLLGLGGMTRRRRYKASGQS
jgi:hypothetical protein